VKKIVICCVLQLISTSASSLYAQVGIGTTTPDPSSVLDISSESQGLLMPRLSSAQRDAIVFPATGLMIWNKTLNDGQLNEGTPAAPSWVGIKKPAGSAHVSISNNNAVSTTSSNDLLIPDMTLSPESGTYVLLFNGQATANESFSSQQGVLDVRALYSVLSALTGGVPRADVVFGNGETLYPGIYDLSGAVSIAGTLTLDAVGDPNALFIIRYTGALTTGANTMVILARGANAKNIFWVSEGAASTTTPTTLKGTVIANNAAISLGANTELEGRMFSTTGAVSMGAGSIVRTPTGISGINLRSLSSFVIFTADGAISGCTTCNITGDVRTGAGATTDFNNITGSVYPAGVNNGTTASSTSTFSVYKNGIQISDSRRSINATNNIISLHSVVTVNSGESVEVRWHVDNGEIVMSKRRLTLIKV